MGEIFVLAEHRQGELRDVTFEMLGKGRELAAAMNAPLAAVLLGHNVDGFATELAKHANQVLVIADERLEHFNSEGYQQVLAHVIAERKPSLVLIGQSACGMDLAPAWRPNWTCLWSPTAWGWSSRMGNCWRCGSYTGAR